VSDKKINIVTGLPRSGTSLQMAILQADGKHIIGKKWDNSEDSIFLNNFTEKEINSLGFFEGVWSNEGITEENFPSQATDDSYIKVFAGGLLKSDLSLIKSAIFMIRDTQDIVNSNNYMHGKEAITASHVEQQKKKAIELLKANNIPIVYQKYSELNHPLVDKTLTRFNNSQNNPELIPRINSGIKNRTAIYLHAYHMQHIPEIFDYLKHVNVEFDLVVSTTPDRFDLVLLSELMSLSPTIFILENRGRDILPFLKLLPYLSNYDSVCKIHTKRDEQWRGPAQATHSMTWRGHMLKSLLEDAKSSIDLLDTLYCPKDMLSGATISSMYRQPVGNSTLYNLCRIIQFYGVNLSVKPFPVGTFFWVKPYNLLWLLKDGYDKLFDKEAGIHGGEIENSFEVVLIQLAKQPSLCSPKFLEGINEYVLRNRKKAREIWETADDEYSKEWYNGTIELLEHRESICSKCMNLQDNKCILTGALFPELTKRGGRGCPIDLWKR